MTQALRSVQNRRWQGWILAGVLLVGLQGTGPCYSDECSNPGEGWCNGDTAVECTGAGENVAYQRYAVDCAAEGLVCVEGRGAGYRGAETKLSWCLDPRTCETAGTFQCSASRADGQSMLMRCVEITSTQWFVDNAIVRFDTTLNLQKVLEPVAGEDSDGGYAYPVETPVACVACSSTCGCDQDSVCRDGWCIPYAVLGESDEDLVCCGRQQGTNCIKGDPCENPDGSQGTCATSARCEPCELDLDCESDLLGCDSTGGELDSVCINWMELDANTVECREGLNQTWVKDACGQWVELAQNCGNGFRCDAGQCIEKVPEIEVSPTLLDFGNVAVGTTKTLPLSVGNIGDWPLEVAELEVQSESADAFTLSDDTMQVAVNQIATLQITFAPTEAGDVQAKLLVHSSDKDEAVLTVLMNGTGTP